ncbi:DUF3572 family protein [Microvirga pudoricolor]|uniref:DUF3572 family protein n=1 Tax=Microvirga pudoricolor TaxID=2778729 RepID=UPI001951AD6F|nr:DUF3572 family protein [Microvirga pudoricolor]MBM6592949.1 DUF3572 family protein [Microvirga pudoricolor]
MSARDMATAILAFIQSDESRFSAFLAYSGLASETVGPGDVSDSLVMCILQYVIDDPQIRWACKDAGVFGARARKSRRRRPARLH